jgi:predicted dithiol-disulfide oxidoreductase (DUF899 family)
MTHTTGTREEWLEARVELLAAEKEHTRRGDALAQQRQALPWVRVDKDYTFETDAGPATLKDLFRGRSQLLIYHFMFGPDYKAGCPSCSMIMDSLNGVQVHLANHDVAFSAVSRAPLPKLQVYKRRMGWAFPWASSAAGDFNFDFNVSLTEEQVESGKFEYNYRAGLPNMKSTVIPEAVKIIAGMTGTDVPTYTRDRPGMSAFVIDNGAIYHTYSAYARGLDAIWTSYQWLDRAPLGRNEQGVWWKRHDEYAAA